MTGRTLEKSRHAGKKIEDHLADFTRDTRILVLSAMALVVGAASALVAYALVWLIGLFTNLAFYQRFATDLVSAGDNRLGAWVILVPVAGGLVIGLLARYGSEKIRGHGIPEALEAILVGRSRMEPKVALLKPLSSAISIGTGGPFGAEGPIIMTGGAFGSLFAQLFNLSSAERRTLLVAGAAGGMSAIFATPVAAVLLAVELLLFEWRPRSFIPVALASAVAGALRVPLLGPAPVFPVAPHAAPGGEMLLAAFGCGMIAGLAATALTALVYGAEDAFARLPVHWMWWPAIGGLLVGVGGWLEPRALGVGYDVIRDLLNGQLWGPALLALLIAKALIWSLALGSGTSGGVLAPLLIIGGALGALEAGWIPWGDRGLWAMVSMAAVMGGVMRSPLTAMIFTLELTHDLNLLPALLVSCVAAMAITVLVMRRSILTEKLARRGHHLMREYAVDPFLLVRVEEVMDPNPPTLPADLPLGELARRIAEGDPSLTREGLAIVDAEGRLAGIITREDVLRAINRQADLSQSVLQAGCREPLVTYPDELVYDAAAVLVMKGIGRLLVVRRDDPDRLVGYLGRAEVMGARLRQFHEERIRERTWHRGLWPSEEAETVSAEGKAVETPAAPADAVPTGDLQGADDPTVGPSRPV